MRTDIYTLVEVKRELVNIVCLQYVDKLLREGRISEKHAKMLYQRYTAKCTGKRR